MLGCKNKIHLRIILFVYNKKKVFLIQNFFYGRYKLKINQIKYKCIHFVFIIFYFRMNSSAIFRDVCCTLR